MSQEVFIRGIISGIMALAFSWAVFSRYDDEIGYEVSDTDKQKYLPYVPGSLLPMFLLFITILGAYFYGFEGAARMTLSSCFTIFLHISLYYLVLLLVIPLFRKIMSARACAMLWLIPNYLYIIYNSYMELPRPMFVITAKGNLAWILLGIWFVGFFAVLVWKCIEHLIFRRQILRDAVPVIGSDVLDVWTAIIEDANFKKPKFKLVASPHVSTPLTIGLFKRSTRVVLPKKQYMKEDLEFILRHELVHIGRDDAWNKFFMVFCTAMCWFNPFVWVAMRKSADDMELSCDETVLLNTDEAARKHYANLLLDTAGDERGFTTCLSATAKAMRYRLQSITKYSKRRSGALIVGAVFFLLCTTCGYVALAYDGDSGAQVLYQSGKLSDYSIRDVSMHEDEFHANYEILDETAFHEYLAGLTLYDLTGNYSYSGSNKYFNYMMDTPNGTEVFVLYDNTIKVVRLHGENRNAEYYYIPGGLDWDYIDSIIVPHPALNVHFAEADNPYGNDFTTHLLKLWKTKGGEKSLIHDGEYPDGSHHGLFGYDLYEASFTFSHELAAPFTVLIESWDYTTSYTISQAEMRDGFTMDLPDYPAHYTVYASFYDADNALYEAEFWFNIGEVGSE